MFFLADTHFGKQFLSYEAKYNIWPCVELEVVFYLAFETKVIYKRYFIFSMNQFYLIRFCFGSSRKFLGPIDFSHFSQKKIWIINVNFLLDKIYQG